MTPAQKNKGVMSRKVYEQLTDAQSDVELLKMKVERLTGANLHLRQAIAYMDDHADSPTIIRREARRALEPKP